VQDQDKKMMVLEIRVGIPVEGFNSLGQSRRASEYIEAVREVGADFLATTVLDKIELV
jgi:hypothetical protein